MSSSSTAGSIVVGADGELLARAKEFAEERLVVDVPIAPRPATTPARPRTVHTRPLLREGTPPAPVPPAALDDIATVWSALVAAIRYWVGRNGVDGVVFGLSGGVDSAMTAVLAVDALGPGGVVGVSLPDPDTLPDELEDAHALAARWGSS